MWECGLLHLYQNCVCGNSLANLSDNLLNGTSVVGGDVVLHLHCIEDHHSLTTLNNVANLNANLKDAAGQGSLNGLASDRLNLLCSQRSLSLSDTESDESLNLSVKLDDSILDLVDESLNLSDCILNLCIYVTLVIRIPNLIGFQHTQRLNSLLK